MNETEVREYLRENLNIRISKDTFFNDATIYIEILLEGEVITKDQIEIKERKDE